MILFRLSLICLSFLIIGCSGSKKSEIPDSLRLLLSANPTLLNPILSTDSSSSSVEGLIFNGLLRVNEKMELVPDLAESYDISDDNKRYTFYLRRDVKWHDGHLFNAQDVKFTLDTLLDSKTNTVRRSSYMVNGKPIKVVVVDEFTVQFVLPEVFSPFLIRSSLSILPEHLLADVDINTTSFNIAPVGTGPYVFKEWKAGQYVRLEKNPKYHGGAPNIDKLLMPIIADPNTALVALEKQEVDRAGIPAKDVKRFKAHSFINNYNYYDLMYTYLGFNLEKDIFKDVRVRKAIAHAINKPALVKGVLKGHGQVADVPSSPLLWSYPEAKDHVYFAFDPDESKSLLRDAGYVQNSDGFFEKDGQVLSFTIMTNKGNKEREKTAQIIQRTLKLIGMDVSIQVMEWSSFIKVVNGQETPKAFDAVILGWSLSMEPDSYSIWHSSQYPKGFNFIGYKNDNVDRLLIEGRLVTDIEQRKKIYSKMYKEIVSDVPYVFLYHPESNVGIQKYVKGLSEPGPAGLMNRIEQVYFQQ
jgi:peptide/nickel transport system substrate-binding protein